MLSQENLEIIKKTVSEFFEKTSFACEIEFLPQDGLTLPVNLECEESQILIGEGGQTLFEIQHILRSMLRKKISEPFFLDIDISNYKKKKCDQLKETARRMADEVSLYRTEKEMASMSAYERRIIHMELADRSDVVTDSIGEGLERRIIVKPKNL
ncbi:MAG: hypothetical protein COZ91_02155 [Candidatus Nealsonbacteria bacterium CG_4_8_14_3_um_filter_39_7]|uniref:R3H domain-containing protein n=1 Tax=Candidatus Nealsonbacteria bacterium CG23_combo_of_CG06-09_8_20_14_all_39_17 TaxID=1974722 RepID=A0A2G9YTM5_9BACT|nr:MAG: hypothetical protein COX37_03115 [Candidatus Nealsonbacteria bacterium CG23_combo_of_CG06-09_8_20_14_all_39_17]PIU44236.1 MAG: hypothetical protein COS96_00070 [Candidatus Nealsonbacteria bacterium CG07_land_8_20_14_0_80_39_13]PIW91116.1 MAG: hypothetical protein COZ91_02155 [Candidatus Nealsonbacteria bacterium CG_4_8_14_3_um_filter_39_7]